MQPAILASLLAAILSVALPILVEDGTVLAQAVHGANPATGTVPAPASNPATAPPTAPPSSGAASPAQTFIRLCDAAAASNLDPSRPAGVPGNKPPDIKPEIAIPACEAAYAAAPDDPRMAYQLGRSYYAAKRYADALPLYQKAAAGGNVVAIHNLGLLYVEGKGANQEEAKGIALIQEAARGGLALSARVLGDYYFLGTHVRKDWAEARRWFQNGAEGGDVIALRAFGLMLQNGQGGAKDPNAARPYLMRAADLGDVAAINGLGFMYFSGEGAPKDLPKARSLFQRGAEGGNAEAMGNLGYMYFNGLGGPRDREKAIFWTRKSAELGNEIAKKNLVGYTAPPAARKQTSGGQGGSGSVVPAPGAPCPPGTVPMGNLCVIPTHQQPVYVPPPQYCDPRAHICPR